MKRYAVLSAVSSGLSITLLIMFLSGLSPVFGDGPEESVDQDAKGNVSSRIPTVITDLKLAKLKLGRHHFYFQASTNNTGTPIYIPVLVLKGVKPGKRLLLTAGVHGDELNGIRVIQELVDGISYEKLSGTIIAIPGLNQPGLHANSRYFTMSSGGGSQSDLNRLFPGTEKGGNAASLYVRQIWKHIIKGRVDLSVDLHTQTQGTIYPLFVFADFKDADAKKMATLLAPDIIKNDAGEKGTLETSLMRLGIPSVTLEVGAPKRFQHGLIKRAVQGIQNILYSYHMLKGQPQRATKAAIIGNDYKNIYARKGGVAVLHKRLLDPVRKGELVATQYDLFGVKIMDYFSPVSGHVLSLATDPVREPGAMLIRILY
jgi:predicted deacylase